MTLDYVYANIGCENCMRKNVGDRNFCEKQIAKDECELIQTFKTSTQKVYKV